MSLDKEVRMKKYAITPIPKEPDHLDKKPRQRQWHSKTRTGCITCKKRRVKCDETRPICNRCTALNRDCEGYAPPQMWLFQPDKQQELIERSLFRVGESSTERHALQFFHEQTLPVLQHFNSCADYFWRSIIPQMSQAQAIIKHQMVAIAATHQLESPANSENMAISVRHYGKALRLLANARTGLSVDVALASCLLFIAFATLRRDTADVHMHLNHGLDILREWKYDTTTASAAANELIKKYIEPIFAALETTAQLAGGVQECSNDDLTWVRPTIPLTFLSFQMAREKFYEIGSWLYHLSRQNPNMFNGRTAEVNDLISLYDEWEVVFSRFRKDHVYKSKRERRQHDILAIQYETHSSTLIAHSSGLETFWDDKEDDMQRWLEECERVYQHEESFDPAAEPLNCNFDFNPGVLPTLCSIARNCRDPTIRKKAVSMLHENHLRFGHVDDCSAALMAGACVELEEQGLDNVQTSADVPESCRVKLLAIDFTQPGKLLIHYTRSPYQHHEQLALPFFSTTPPPTLIFRMYPMSELMRCAGYQGLIRPRSIECRCKTYGTK